MTKKPTITVITVAHDKGAVLTPSVLSVLRQRFDDFTYLLIDDGSTDESFRYVSEIEDERLVVRRQQNSGFTATLHAALADVRTPYIAVHGAGDYSHPDRLGEQIEYLRAGPELAMVGCFARRRKFGDPRELMKFSVPVSSYSVTDMIERNVFLHGEVLMRTDAYRAAGGYRPFFRYAQDRDLWLRLLRHGSAARVPKFLYTQIMAGPSVAVDPARADEQAKLSLFARALAKRRLEGAPELEDEFLPEAFACYVSALGEAEKAEVARRIAIARQLRNELAKSRKAGRYFPRTRTRARAAVRTVRRRGRRDSIGTRAA